MTTAEAQAWNRYWQHHPSAAEVCNYQLAAIRAAICGGGEVNQFLLRFAQPEPKPKETEATMRAFFRSRK